MEKEPSEHGKSWFIDSRAREFLSAGEVVEVTGPDLRERCLDTKALGSLDERRWKCSEPAATFAPWVKQIVWEAAEMDTFRDTPKPGADAR